jgi:hypothetical protein
MQFKTKLGLVDISNGDVLNAARDIARDGTERIPALMDRIQELEDAGCGSSSHLAEWLGVKPTAEIRHLANVLTCANDSLDVKAMLARLAE